MRTPFSSAGTTLSAWLGALLFAATTSAAAQRDLPFLPFVDSAGVVVQDLRRSTVVRVLGEPAPGADPAALHYPAVGLRFELAAGEGAGAGARVAAMQVTAAAAGKTPGGLHVGMPQAVAVPLLEQDYRLLERRLAAQGTGRPMPPGDAPGDALVALHLTARDPPLPRTLTVNFERGAVSSLRFTTQDPAPAHDPTRRTLAERSLAQQLVIAAAALSALAAIFFGHRWPWRRRSFVSPERAGPVGAGVVAVGLLLLWLSFVGWRQSEGWGRVLPLAGFGGALGALLLGVSVMATSASRWWAWPAQAGLVLVVAAILLNQTGWFGH